MVKHFSIFLWMVLMIFPNFSGADDQEVYTFKLTQSTTAYQFWTTTPGERVFKDDDVPSETGSEVKVYAAKNEFEPFQIIVKPSSSGNIIINSDNFGAGIITEIYQVKYINISQKTDSLGRTGPYPDPLWPLESGASINISAGENTAFWFSIFVPSSTPSGDYSANFQIGGVDLPVILHVFNFAIPDELHIKSQMNFNQNTILTTYSVSGADDYWMYVNKIKQYFIDHRLTLKSALWSGGLTSSGGKPYIDYNCDTGVWSDAEGIWGFEIPARKYIGGEEISGQSNNNGLFNDGTGFPSFMAVTFQNNDSSKDQRPSSFCGLSRGNGDWYIADNSTSAYNQKWFAYIHDMQEYLRGLGFLDEAYYYFANEPQDQADYDAVAWYSKYLKQKAPDLKLMVSENPRTEIFNHLNYSSGQIDIWLPVFNQYDPEISHEREKNHGEETWIYFLHGTRPPFFNPITLDHPGVESKLTGWILWKYRIRGIAYYSLNNWEPNPWTNPIHDNHNGDLFMLYPPSESNHNIDYGSNNHRLVPSIRFELMRDSLEDYEYLYVLNADKNPLVTEDNSGDNQSADSQADKIVTGLTSYTRDTEFMYNLRRVIGLKNGNEIAVLPDINPTGGHPRTEGPPGNYYINFQDPASSPGADPLSVNGHEYMKIGWNEYDQDLGYGWFGDMAHVKYQYISSSPNELQNSIIYDNWGREKTFEFDLPNGTYNVTVSVGWQAKTYSHNKIVIEGVSFVDDEAITPASPYIIRTKAVSISDNKLTMAMGIFNEYTMLNYLDIESNGTVYTITPSTGANGTIDPATAQSVVEGSNFTFTIKPANGYEVDAFEIDSAAAVLTDNKYTFTNVVTDHTINVTFKALPQYTVTPTAGANGSISPSSTQTVSQGSDLTFSVTPADGYVVDTFEVDSTTAVLTANQYVFTNIIANHTIAVTFKAIPQYTVTPTAGANGSISPSSLQTVDQGANLTFTIIPLNGYLIDTFTVNDQPAVLTNNQYTFANISDNHTIAVTFKAVPEYTITPVAGVHGTITPSTPQIVEQGSSLTFTVNPHAEYEVDAFKVDDQSAVLTNNQYTFTNIDADHSIAVTFKKTTVQQYVLTATAGPNGTISPEGEVLINAGNDRTFTISALNGYEIDQCKVDHQTATLTNNQYVFTNVTADHTIAVTFKPITVIQYLLTASASFGGSISPSGIVQVEAGKNKTFYITPASGYELAGLTVDGQTLALTNGQYTFTAIGSNHSIHAAFTLINIPVPPVQQYTITAADGNHGSITPSGNVYVKAGSSQTFTISADPGYEIDLFLVDGQTATLMNGKYTFLYVNANHSISVIFKGIQVQQYNISAVAGENGKISPSGNVQVNAGDRQTFAITAEPGFEVDTFRVDEQPAVLTAGQYTLTQVNTDHSITVTFKSVQVQQYELTITSGTNGSIIPSGHVSINAGASQSFTIKADPGFEVDMFIVDSLSETLLNNQYILTDIEQDHIISVAFKPIPVQQYKITANADAGGSITPSGDIRINAGSEQTFTITPAAGFSLDQVMIDGKADALNNGQYTFTNVSTDHLIQVSFVSLAIDNDRDRDGVLDPEDDYPDDRTKATPQADTGTGKILIDTTLNPGTTLSVVKTILDSDPGLNQTGKPSGYEFRHGLVSYQVNGVEPGASINISITFPADIPEDSRCYKVRSNGFYEFTNAVINGRTLTLTLTDGGQGDADGLKNGEISNIVGIAEPVTSKRRDSNVCFISISFSN